MTVPAECWKIIVVEPDDGGDDLARISQDTRVIAVIMPNDQEQVGEEWSGFRTSAAAVERETGLHFFDRVRPRISRVFSGRRWMIGRFRPHGLMGIAGIREKESA